MNRIYKYLHLCRIHIGVHAMSQIGNVVPGSELAYHCCSELYQFFVRGVQGTWVQVTYMETVINILFLKFNQNYQLCKDMRIFYWMIKCV